ncbi:MAG: CCA tRNA nucleotidyltransferase [Saccharofermentanales bacterium]|nr:hypothetical protein [Clostridiaceae bacterium]
MAVLLDYEKIPDAVRTVINKIDRAGYEAWLVGGCVRDLCLGLIPKDFDLATNARPEQIQNLFVRHFLTGARHGTVTVLWQGMSFEITTFRSESSYSDARRPDQVIFRNTIAEDLARRDFTINSLAWRPDCGLLDLYDGLSDLQQGVLRTVGDPQARFGEDLLRLLRAVRFAVNYNLAPVPALVQAAAEHARSLGQLSRERMIAEMITILCAPHVHQLKSFAGSGIMAETARLFFAVRTDDRLLCHNLSRLVQPDLPESLRLPLFYLCSVAPDLQVASLRHALGRIFVGSSGKAVQDLFMREARLPRRLARDAQAILYLYYLRLLIPPDRPLSVVSQCRLFRLLARHGGLKRNELHAPVEMTARLLKLSLGAVFSEPALSLEVCRAVPLTLEELALNGHQLQIAGLPSGPALGNILQRLLSRTIQEPRLNQPADLMAIALFWLSSTDQPRRARNETKLS